VIAAAATDSHDAEVNAFVRPEDLRGRLRQQHSRSLFDKGSTIFVYH
jgi:hypothetical protein